jgi:hypothetical protein
MSVPMPRKVGSALVELNYDIEIPPWWEGPHRQDLPK